MRILHALNHWLDDRAPPVVLALAGLGVLVVEGIDYLTGYEVSLSLLYLGPIALAAWYAGRWPGIAISLLSCLGWYVADWAAGSHYSSAAIPVWNAFVRLGFFVITAELLVALRTSLTRQRHLARTDALTGLFGRRQFDERLAHDLALAERHGLPLSLAYIDVDDFKSINDTHGHAAGDHVLRALSDVLSSEVREVDTAARLGGDEFALILPDTDDRGARVLASKLMRGLDRAVDDIGFGVSCSVGIVTFLDCAVPIEEAIGAGDAVMYEVKKSGKGSVAYRIVGQRDDTGPTAGRLSRLRILHDERQSP